MQKLDKAVREAESIFLHRVIPLARLQHPNHPTPITFKSVKSWLEQITHTPNGRHRRPDRNYATAYPVRQQIIYNPKWVETAEELFLLDLVLHEMGHLFNHYFLNGRGHDHKWQHIGTIVGYAPVGATTPNKRKNYRTFAAHAGQVDVHEKPLGSYGTVRSKRRHSTVDSPVSRAWEIFNEHGHYYSRRELIGLCVDEGINPNTASTQYSKWRKENVF